MSEEKIERQFKYFSFLSMLYSTLLIASVLLPYKIINFFGFDMPGGIFIFPLTYLLGGVIAEAYGRNLALKMVYSSIACLMLFNIIVAFIVYLPSSDHASNQTVFIQAFGHSIRLSIGCLAGLICSDINNIYRITKLKLLFYGKYFIQRCLWATAISEAIFNVVTYTITYYGVMSNHDLLQLMINSWCLKMGYSLLMILPILKLMEFVKKLEGVDSYDVQDKKFSRYDLELLFAKFVHSCSSKEQAQH